MSQNVRMFIHV